MDITLSWVDNSDGAGVYKIYRSTLPFDMSALPEPLEIPIRKYIHRSKMADFMDNGQDDPLLLTGGTNESWLIAGDVVPVGIKHYYMISLSDSKSEVFGDTITFGENTPLEPIVLVSTGYNPFEYRIVGGSGTIDYGDGTVEELDIGNPNHIEHIYSQEGEYTITIQLTSPAEIIEVYCDELVSWGGGYYNIRFMNSYTVLPLEFSPYLTSMENMLMRWNEPSDISGWDVSKVTDMDRLFEGSREFYGNLSMWDVSNVHWFNFTFSRNGIRSNLSNWDTSNAVSMEGMFADAYEFNSNLTPWELGKMRSMDGMFAGARSFNQDLSLWCVKQFNEEPPYFSTGTPDWFSPKPVWGTCPVIEPLPPTGLSIRFMDAGGPGGSPEEMA